MLNAFDTRTMLKALEQSQPPKTFLLDTFFPTISQSDTETVDIDIIKGKRKLAPFVAPMHEGKVVVDQGYHTDTFKPPYVKPKKITSAMDLLKRAPGNTIYQNDLSPIQKAAQKVGNDLRELQEMITRREEWMAAQALTTGKIHVQGDGIDKVIDFHMRPDHKEVLANNAKWTEPNSDPLRDLRRWQNKIVQDSGLVARTAVLGSEVLNALLDHKKVQKLLDNNRMNMGAIDPKSLPNGAKYWGRIDDIDLFSYNEWYLDDQGIEQPMIKENMLILGSDSARTARHYGAIQDLDATAAVRYFPKSWTQEDPSVRFVMLQSAPLVIPHQIDAFMSMQVL
ncbi:MAG: major capsid protein [Candidatus Berkiella sp.]